MPDHGPHYWKNGSLIAWAGGGTVSLFNHSLHYGVGPFEGIRAYQRANGETTLFRLHDHVRRLFDSCRLVLIEPPVSEEQVVAGCVELLQGNEMAEGYLRPMILLGSGAMGIMPSDNPPEAFILAWKWGAYLGADGLERGIRCKLSPYTRHHVSANLPKAKVTGQYVTSVMAKRDAKLSGFDEALMCDVNGYVTEGTGENLFIVRRGRVVTPPVSGSILEGITRDTVITLAREEGLSVDECPITRDELYLADEIFLTGTAAEVTPVREVDHHRIGEGRRGPITTRLQARYFDVVRGSDDAHPEWHTLLSR